VYLPKGREWVRETFKSEQTGATYALMIAATLGGPSHGRSQDCRRSQRIRRHRERIVQEMRERLGMDGSPARGKLRAREARAKLKRQRTRLSAVPVERRRYVGTLADYEARAFAAVTPLSIGLPLEASSQALSFSGSSAGGGPRWNYIWVTWGATGVPAGVKRTYRGMRLAAHGVPAAIRRISDKRSMDAI